MSKLSETLGIASHQWTGRLDPGVVRVMLHVEHVTCLDPVGLGGLWYAEKAVWR